MSSTLIAYKLARSNYLEISDLLNVSKVCKKWHHFFDSNYVWGPIFTRLYPIAKEFDLPENIKSTVLNSLKKETSRVDEILSWLKMAKPYVNADEQLADIIGSTHPSFEDLCKASRIQRTWKVMQGLTHNSHAVVAFCQKAPQAASKHYDTSILTMDKLLKFERMTYPPKREQSRTNT